MANAKRQSKIRAFAGQFCRVVDAQCRVRLPAEWRSIMSGDRELFVMANPDKTKSLLVVTAEEYRKAKKHSPATLVKIAADGRVRIPKELLAHAGIEGTAYFTGIIRTISMSASRPDCDDRIDLAAIFEKLR